MKLETTVDNQTHQRHYHLTIDDEELIFVKLDELDDKMIEECKNSASIADQLLALQTIAFRLEQQKGFREGAKYVGKQLTKEI